MGICEGKTAETGDEICVEIPSVTGLQDLFPDFIPEVPPYPRGQAGSPNQKKNL